MIFLTTGSELPFNRLVRAVDMWCATKGRSDVIGQLGRLGPDDHQPAHFQWHAFLAPDEYNRLFAEAEVIVAHAGMGSIISALTLSKPILMLPRLARLNETRNDHQVATLRRFVEREGVYGAETEEEIPALLDRILGSDLVSSDRKISSYADEAFTGALRTFLLS